MLIFQYHWMYGIQWRMAYGHIDFELIFGVGRSYKCLVIENTLLHRDQVWSNSNFSKTIYDYEWQLFVTANQPCLKISWQLDPAIANRWMYWSVVNCFVDIGYVYLCDRSFTFLKVSAFNDKFEGICTDLGSWGKPTNPVAWLDDPWNCSYKLLRVTGIVIKLMQKWVTLFYITNLECISLLLSWVHKPFVVEYVNSLLEPGRNECAPWGSVSMFQDVFGFSSF